MSSREYLSAVATAKLVRLALKESFPGIKFSVRADNNSINVGWSDGPNAKQVEEVAKTFEGGYFDGMIDYAGSCYHKLNGKPVHFGSKYVFCSRTETPELITAAIAYLRAKYGEQIPAEASVENYKAGKLSSVYPTGGWSYEHSLQSMIWKAAAKRTAFAMPAKSATLASIEFEGDDGYGHGTVGMNGEGGDMCAQAQMAARERQAEKAPSVAEQVVLELLTKLAPGSEVLQ